VQRGLELGELIECWTLVGEELERARSKRGVNALAFGVLLKFVINNGRFPRGRSEIPDESVEFVARKVGFRLLSWGFTSGLGARSSGTVPRFASCWTIRNARWVTKRL
jgi:hypothetical protein